MQNQINQGIRKIVHEVSSIGPFSKAVLKYGSLASLALLALGTLLVVVNREVYNFDLTLEFTAISLVKTSFTIFAEVMICGLLADYISKKL